MKIALLGDMAFFGKFDINQNPKIKDYFKEVGEYLSQGFLVSFVALAQIYLERLR